jgi:hypothetical protein
VGIAFPGPNVDGRWYSNNLTDDFRDGVRLEQIVRAALVRACTGIEIGQVIAVLDAQADAGGEVFHPDGALHRLIPGQGACVLNIATGVAAGFVTASVSDSGRPFVLRSAEEFSAFTARMYDNNAGHLGRHLVSNVDGAVWRYEYMPAGRLVADADSVRLSDVVSGPALAARWALRVIDRGLDGDIHENAHISWLLKQARQNRDPRTNGDLRGHLGLAAHIRKSHEPVSAEVLDWIDSVMVEPSAPTRTRTFLHDFRNEIARNLGGALACWQAADGWTNFRDTIVLTGGVGQKAFRRTDSTFLAQLRMPLATGTQLMRSTLEGGCERAAWFFDRGVFGPAIRHAP